MFVFGTFVEYQMALAVRVYVWMFYSILLVYVSVFVPVPCCFCYYGSVACFEVRYCDTSALLFWLRITLTIQGLWCFQMIFWIDFYISVKKMTYMSEGRHWDFGEDHIEYIDYFW
jgi:hypothetical protein